jgi:uncharacterized protein
MPGREPSGSAASPHDCALFPDSAATSAALPPHQVLGSPLVGCRSSHGSDLLALMPATRHSADPGYWLDTASGRRVNLANPDPNSIALEDVAGALSRICRFGGHSREYYSVAQHAVLVERIVARWARHDLRLPALHHDSHEAFLCDLPSPLKHALEAADDLRAYRELRCRFDRAIADALGVPRELSPDDIAVIAEADALAFQVEAERFLAGGGRAAIADHGGRNSSWPEIACPAPLDPPAAARAFEAAHWELTTDRTAAAA